MNCTSSDLQLETVDLSKAMRRKALLIVGDLRKVHGAADPALAFAVAVAGLSICSEHDFRRNSPVSGQQIFLSYVRFKPIVCSSSLLHCFAKFFFQLRKISSHVRKASSNMFLPLRLKWPSKFRKALCLRSASRFVHLQRG